MVQVPYVSCPAALRDLADAVRAVPTDGAREVLICPGLVSRDGDGVPDVMRGEEGPADLRRSLHLHENPGNGFASRHAQQACCHEPRLDQWLCDAHDRGGLRAAP